LTFFLQAKRTVNKAHFGLALWGSDGSLLWAMRSLDNGGNEILLTEGLYKVKFKAPILPLRPGTYRMLVSANDLAEGTLDAWYAKPNLQVLARRDSGLPPQWQGILSLDGEFELIAVEALESKTAKTEL
jgi:hypothetical protein